MASFNLSFALICLSTLSIFTHQTHAQNSQQDYLNAHNSARALVSVGNIVWNTTLANYAQNYANQRVSDCSLAPSNGPYGENIATGSGSFTGTAAVNLWVAEKTYYDYATNTCATNHVCAHYTQVVWSDSVQVGCARVQCTNNGWWFVICGYSPKGNVAGVDKGGLSGGSFIWCCGYFGIRLAYLYVYLTVFVKIHMISQ